MKFRKKKEETEEVGGDDLAPMLHMLEALRLAVLTTGAGSGTQEARQLRVASDALAERALRKESS